MLDDIKYIAKEAGKIIRDGFGKNFSYEYKTNTSNIVTEIDKKSEDLIKEFIFNNYSTHSILAEESGETNNNSEYVWIIDPLDGTTNFAHGLPIFSVSIGVQLNNKTIAGVVYDVMFDNLYSAELNCGSFCNDVKMRVSNQDKIPLSLAVTGFPYNVSENPENAFELFEKLTRQSRGVRRLGSAAIDFCYVARGVFDYFWEVSLNPWDVCAGQLIVEEAGGMVTDFKGNETMKTSNTILCSNSILHQQLLNELKL
ncbi:MAG: inositol monophosphatase [Ignavibacteriaceae bacterium]|nr:inositol monophosphatase [Ignavibacteriaceae bacterium]